MVVTPTSKRKMMTMMIRTYTQIQKIPDFIGRYNYLKLQGIIGEDTFGFDRYVNQVLYTSQRWRKIRDDVIIRDQAFDLGIPGRDIYSNIYVHHMNPITKKQILEQHDFVFNPEYLICTSFGTHNAIHFGNADSLPKLPIDRQPGDTNLWEPKRG